MTRTPHTSLPIAIAAGLGVALMYLAWAYPALGHDALPTAAQPEGWRYPFSCCSGYDCREVGSSRSGSARYRKALPANWYSGTDLRSRPKFVPPLRPLSLTKLMRNRKASIEAMKRRHREWGLPC